MARDTSGRDQTNRWTLGAALAIAVAAAVRPLVPSSDAAALPLVSAGVARTASLGREPSMATAIWMRTVDAYAQDSLGPARIASSLRTIGDLDPGWVEPWFFGILMLSESSNELRSELLEEAAVLHPQVPWFAWRRGMEVLVDDRPAAVGWLERAANAPGADPAWRTLLDQLRSSP